MRAGHCHDWPRVVIVGAGFGGLSAARGLEGARAHVTLIDRRNHHLFQPLLYQIATAGLSPNQIARPIRAVLRKQRNVDVVLGEVTGVDTYAQDVLIGARRLPYDYLVLATGATHSYFGNHHWAQFAPGLKSIEDATAHRRRILTAFERAEVEPNEDERKRLMTFVVIGAGPTGVELAGAIAELARKALVCDFRHISPCSTRILLVEAGRRVLPGFKPALSQKAQEALEAMGVDVLLGAPVTAMDEDGVTIADETIPARTILWAAGVQSSDAGRWINSLLDRSGRAHVDETLSAPHLKNVFVIGDCAHAKDAAGKPLPGVAPVAKQQGAYVARLIATRLDGHKPPEAFRYNDHGAMATIGRRSAIAEFGAVTMHGFLAWLVWSIAHVYFLIGVRNRIAVAIDWLWSYLTFERGARLITDASPPQRETVDAAVPRRHEERRAV